MKKFLSISLFFVMIFIFTNISSAANPTYPLANITAYKFFKNMGYELDLRKPAAITPDGCPTYGTGLPESSLMQSSQYANTLLLTNKNGDKILGIKLFFRSNANRADVVAVLSKVTKALDENIFEKMGADWVAETLNEFIDTFNSKNKLIGLKEMNFWYKYSGNIKNGVFTVEITAEPE